METLVAQFTAKTTNSEKAIYFFLLMSCSINKLKSHMLFTSKNFMFSEFTWEKNFCSRKWWKGGGKGVLAPRSPFLYGPAWSRLLLRKEEIRPNIWREIQQDLCLWRRTACQTCQKPWIYQVTARVVRKAYQIQLSEDLQLIEKT